MNNILTFWRRAAVVSAVLVASVVIAAAQNAGTNAVVSAPSEKLLGATYVEYDNFNATFLDPWKWSLYTACFNFNSLECVREIQNGSLRLEVRSFGATNSNSGQAIEFDELHFKNPAPIRRIAAQMTVRRANVTGCPANPDLQSEQSLLSGTFFNSGSGDPSDDVQAFLDIEHFAADPVGQLDASGFLYWQGQFFGGVGLGHPRVGRSLIAQLSWDQPHHQFIVSWTDLYTGNTERAVMAYTMSDTMQGAAPDKVLAVRTFVPNCVGTSMKSAFVETTFDTVWIGE